MRKLVAIFSISCLSFVSAQQGNRKEHHSMDPVVPAQLIPTAPVLSPEKALKSFDLAPGFVMEAFATEPLVEKPVALDFDPAGRAWVVEMIGYMMDLDGKDESVPQGRIVVLEDTNADGKADKRTVFLDQVLLPRAVAVYPDGVLYLDDHDLRWIKRDGLKPAGESIVAAPKFIEAGNVEHKVNGLMRGLDNWHYNAKSGKRVRRDGDRWIVENTPFRGQWGISQDNYGRLYHNNNSTFLFGDFLAPNLLAGNPGVNLKVNDAYQLGSNHTYPSRVTPGVNRAYIQKSNGYTSDTLDPKTYKLLLTTASAGPVIYRGTNFPAEWAGRGFTPESAVNLIKATHIDESGVQLKGSHPLGKKEFLTSTDERFRPVNLYNAPDGSLLVLDLYHGIIQDRFFMTSYLRAQYASRQLDGPAKGHGRIWRIRATSGKLETITRADAMKSADLVKQLAHANGWHRDIAQRELVDRRDLSVVPALLQLASANDQPLGQIHALWTLEGLQQLTAAAVSSALQAKTPKVVVSALWASTKLPAKELQALAPALLKFQPATDEQVIYLARALGPIASPEAFAQLEKLLAAHPKLRFLKAAAFSGLDHQEAAFRNHLQGRSKDKEWLAWLDKGASSAGKAAISGDGLAGEHLASFERGKAHYSGAAACFGCHGAAGEGVPNLGPPLDESEYVTGSPERLIKILLHGLTGPITVAGVRYSPTADMPGLMQNPLMKDTDIADIATYIRHEWSNRAAAVSADIVREVRQKTSDRTGNPYREADLKE
jgi:glucose/arabinose dehydrogenase/mono/diheme cytochrome c family protein